ncbi:uncharacterized protein LOC118742281 [Rhagoletis pomonella]|uniref:uncharacterized protein LOC118742281 n=1 Tax=Rhagoletis pomonella TaxID=28610 RepID=UPI00178418EA|nr:uncharacterized protein LOC118742281 [Rhagoletis pomonella]
MGFEESSSLQDVVVVSGAEDNIEFSSDVIMTPLSINISNENSNLSSGSQTHLTPVSQPENTRKITLEAVYNVAMEDMRARQQRNGLAIAQQGALTIAITKLTQTLDRFCENLNKT